MAVLPYRMIGKDSDGQPIFETRPLFRALNFAAQGIPVFPCRERDEIDPSTGVIRYEEKSPYVPGGFKAATTDPEIIRKWWERLPDASIGIPTGKSTKIVVLDVDERDNRSGFESLAQAGIKPPPTFANPTRNNGFHGFYRRPEVEEFPGRGGILPGLDIKADGGYVIAWGDLRPENLQNLPEWPEALTEALEAARQDLKPRNADPAPQAAGLAADHSSPDVDADRMMASALGSASMPGGRFGGNETGFTQSGAL